MHSRINSDLARPFSRPQAISAILSRWFVEGRGFPGRRFPPALPAAKPQVSWVVMHSVVRRTAQLTLAKVLVDGHFLRGGAGGNRTPVHQPVDEPATTIPVPGADAAPPAGRLTVSPHGAAVRARSFPRVSVLSCRQRSFPPSSPASVAGLRWIGPVRHFCSRCLCAHLRIRRRE